jgi:hypothetical protein
MRSLKQLGDLAPANDLSPASPRPAYSHRTRRGVTYYLHRGTTKTGKPRYFFAKSIGDGALAEMPAGYEVAESVNGVVTVRKGTAGSPFPAADVTLIRDALERDPQLRQYLVESKGGAIVVHEPERGGGPTAGELAGLARELGVTTFQLASHFARTAKTISYTPMMKFERAFVGDTGQYLAYRMTYRGRGGWHSLSHGPLATLVKKYVPHLGRQSFFDLI